MELTYLNEYCTHQRTFGHKTTFLLTRAYSGSKKTQVQRGLVKLRKDRTQLCHTFNRQNVHRLATNCFALDVSHCQSNSLYSLAE